MGPTTTRIISWLIPAALGAGAAVLLAPLVGSAPPSSESAPVAERPRAKAWAPVGASSRASSGTAAGWAPRATDSEPEDDEPSTEPDDDEDAAPGFAAPEAEYSHLLEGRSHHESRWRGEPIDASWAGGAEDSLQRDLEDIAAAVTAKDGGGFEIREIACRSTMCQAQIEWASATKAVEHAERIALASYGAKCGIFLLGPSPETLAQDASFAQEVYFDCTEGQG